MRILNVGVMDPLSPDTLNPISQETVLQVWDMYPNPSFSVVPQPPLELKRIP